MQFSFVQARTIIKNVLLELNDFIMIIVKTNVFFSPG